MKQSAFQLNALRRAIRTQGRVVDFTLKSTNEFGEPDGEAKTYSVRGVYHETTGYLSKTTSGAATIREKSSPQVLLLHEDSLSLIPGMGATFNGKTYELVELKNISELNLVCSASLEEVQTDA